MGEIISKLHQPKTLTAIIITKNEESMIANCISSLRFVNELIVVDSGSADNTISIAAREGAKIIEVEGGTFADWRNAGKDAASSDWLLYVDADERVTPKLANEITRTIEYTSNAAYALKRNNIHFGKWLEHGGWNSDTIVRLFKRSQLVKWEGEVHEHAIIDGVEGELKEPLVHLTHRSIRDGLLKSYSWTDTEARMLLAANATQVTSFTLVRKTLMEFIRRLLVRKGYKDGMEGWIESFQQAVNRFFVYARLWELQQKPTLDEKYDRIEKEIYKLWEAKGRSKK